MVKRFISSDCLTIKEVATQVQMPNLRDLESLENGLDLWESIDHEWN